MGAMSLLEYQRLPAGQRPVEPDALVLVGTAAGRLAQRGVGRLLGVPLIGLVADVVGHTPHRGGDRAVRTLVRPVCRTMTRVCGLCDAERDTLTATVADAVYSTPLSTAVGFLRSLKTFDAYDVLASIQARTIVVSGGADLLTPDAHARDLVAGIPGATHCYLPAAGHMLLHEAPHAVTDEIARTVAVGVGSRRPLARRESAMAAGLLEVAQ
jgi:pimeloyl-ACP methyl ester carboxylesterase